MLKGILKTEWRHSGFFLLNSLAYVVFQFYPWFKFYFLLLLGIIMSFKQRKINLNQG